MFIFQFVIFLFSVIQVECQNIDCASSPCKNEAICEDTLTGYQCFCKDGYAGENCEVDFNDCISQPCKNNATCIDDVASYSCLCANGFIGDNCQTNINECESNPCIQNSTCIDMVNGYVCQCMPPLRGENCSVLPCETTPCANEAICRNDLNFNESVIGFVCDCLSGFTGSRCEINIEDCDLDSFTSCSGSGICVDGINDFSCLCEPGWVGARCQSPMDDCIGNSCKNNATCFDRHLGYDCQCSSGYGGALCERQIDECSELAPCENGATCVDMFNGYRCECTSGWHGKNCTEEVNECETNPCHNGADCIDIVDGFVCRCPPFYTGLLCETQFNPCAAEYNQCQNGANCVVPPDGQYRCYCPAGLTGSKCEVNIDECVSAPCRNNGTCEDIINGYICHCGLGWSGKNCGVNIDECASNPCLNGADCQDLLYGFKCNCTWEYQGRQCEEAVDFCLQQPCLHNGECISIIGDFECICLPPYTGERCLDLIDACSSNPCVNNGTCMNTERGFMCNCQSPYTGATCSDEIDFCASEPCFNEGTCLSLVNDFYCACQEYLTGKQCTDFSDFCLDFPCKNDANCISGEFEYRCVCAYGYTGGTCEQMIDFCIADPCLNEANCSNVPGGFVCECPTKFTGDLCQNTIPPAHTSSVKLSSTPVTTATSFPNSESFSIIFSNFISLEPSLHSTIPLVSHQPSLHSTKTLFSASTTSLYVLNPLSTLPYSLFTDIETPSKRTTELDTSYSSTFAQRTMTEYKTLFSSEFITTTVTTNTESFHLTSSISGDIFPSKSSTNMKFSSQILESQSYLSFSLSTTAATVLRTHTLSTDSHLDVFTKATFSPISDNEHSVSMSTLKITVFATTFLFSDVVSYRSIFSPVSLSDAFVNLSTSAYTAIGTTSLFTISQIDSTTSVISPTSIAIFETSISYISNEIESSFVLYTYTNSLQTPLISSLTDSDFSLSLSQLVSSDTSSDINLNITTTAYSRQITSQYVRISDSNSVLSSYEKKSITLSSTSILKTAFTSVASQFSSSYSADSNSVLSSYKKDSITLTSTSILKTAFTSVASQFSSSYSADSNSVLSSYKKDSITLTSTSILKTAFTFVASQFSSSYSVNSSNSDILYKSPTRTPLLPSVQFTPSVMSSQSSTASFLSTFHSDMEMITPSSLDVRTSHNTIVSTRTSNSGNSTLISNFSLPLRTSLTKTLYLTTSPALSDTSLSSLEETLLSMNVTSSAIPTLLSSLVSLSTYSSQFELSSLMYSISSVTTLETSFSFNSAYTTDEMSIITSTKFGGTNTNRTDSSPSMSVFGSTERISLLTSFSSNPTETKPVFTSITSSTHAFSYSSDFNSSVPVFLSSDLKSTIPNISFPSNKLSPITSVPSYVRSSHFSNDKPTSSVDVFDSSFTVISVKSASIDTISPITYSATLNSSLNFTPVVSTDLNGSDTPSVNSTHYITASSTKKINSSSTKYSVFYFTSTLTVTSSEIAITSSNTESSIFFSTTPSVPVTTLNSTFSSPEFALVSSTEHSVLPSYVSSYTFSPTAQTSDMVSSYSVSLSPSTTSLHYVTSAFSSTSSATPESASLETTLAMTASVSQGGTSSKIHISPTPSAYTVTISTTSKIDPYSTPTSIFTKTASSTSVMTTSVTTTESLPPSCGTFVCQNGGVCREDYLGIFCDCGSDFIGKNCEIESNTCNSYECENDALCSVITTRFGTLVPICNCRLPFTGTRCENEKLIYYPSFTGNSYLEFTPPTIEYGQSNEIYISVKTKQEVGTILFAANQIQDNNDAGFIHLYLTNGELRYKYSCDGLSVDIIHTNMLVNTGDIYNVILRQVWSQTVGDWCTTVVIINDKVSVGKRLLSLRPPQSLGNLYIGGLPRYSYQLNDDGFVHILDGFIGCVHNFQINQREIDLVSMATKASNIDNCNVPVCVHNPCKNDATCHSSGEEWYCSCRQGYGGALCERKLCDVNPCFHGGTCIVLEVEQDQLCLCAFGRGGALCEDDLHVSMPHFVGRQYEYSSFVAYDSPHYIEDNFEIQFDFIVNNESSDSSVLLYIGNTGSYDGRQDFMAVGLYLGHVVFRYDLGSGFGQIFSADPLDASLPQHAVRVGRTKQYGWLQVDDQRNITGRSPGVLTALNTNSKLYVGDIELSEIGVLSDDNFFKNGLNGCIFNLKIKNRDTDFLPPGFPPGHVSEGRNVGQCSSLSCDHEPCNNGGKCIDIGASVYCNCTGKWKGTFCTDSITVCDLAHACATGSTCLPVGDDAYKCICPLGRKGEHCDQEIQISDAKFLGEHSFMSFAPVFVKRRMDIRLQIKPENGDGLLFYAAQRLHSTSGDFMSLTLHRGYVTFRLNLGTGTNTIRNGVSLSNGSWYTVEAGRNITHGYITVNNETVTDILNGTMSFMDITTHFYLGSLPNLADAAPDAFVGEPVSFTGCVREFVVNENEYAPSEEGAVQGADIGDCDDTSCGYRVCHHGVCTASPNSTYVCSCSNDYVGERCDIPVQCANHSCEYGECVAELSDSYRCDCSIGWTDRLCDKVEILGNAVRFNADSFVSIMDKSHENGNKSLTSISFELRYQQLEGLVLWNGETTSDDEDYLGLGLKDGRIKLVWSLGWYARDTITTSLKYNDGLWHKVDINRNGQVLTMAVDDGTYESRVSGDFFQLDTVGKYHFGGFRKNSDIDSTMDHFIGSFTGCLRDLVINKRVIDFSDAEDGRNIDACD